MGGAAAGKPRVFVSSVQGGFEELRGAARRVIEAMGFEYVGMEGFGPREDEPDVTCWREVAGCDLYVGLLGWRYGSHPHGSNQSFTEREYRYARLLDMPCYVLLAADGLRDDELASHPEASEHLDRQIAFRRRVQEDPGGPTTGTFADLGSLRRGIEEAMRDWSSTPHPAPGTLFGRRRLLRDVHQAVARPGGGAVLLGLPGMGKSALFDTVIGWFAGDRGPGWDVTKIEIPDGGMMPVLNERIRGAGRPLLIAVDNVWPGHVDELADHLRRLPDRGLASILITTRFEEVAGRFHELRLPTHQVEPIDAAAAAQMLTWEVVRRAGERAADFADLGRLQSALGGVAEIVDGYPEALVLVGGRIGAADASLPVIADQAGAMRRALVSASDDDVLQRLEDRLLPYLLQALPPEAIEVLKTLSVLRPKPAGISGADLETLWAKAPGRGRRSTDPDRLSRRLGHLMRARLLHVDDDGRYQMHGIVAKHVRTRHLSARARRSLHRIAATIFHDQVRTRFDSLTSMYAIETQEWQEPITAWLYHLAPLDFVQALFWIVSWYLDAFWWWGSYVEFAFCDLLLHAWEHAEVPAASRASHRATTRHLRTLHTVYPRGWWAWASPGDLRRVREALDALADLVGLQLEGDLDPADDDDGSRLHLRALFHVFLADCFRADLREAERHYERALAAFEQRRRRFGTEADAWNEGWIPLEVAALRLLHGDLEQAERLCRTAEEREIERIRRVAGEDHLLHELLANVARVRADIAWRRGDVCAAAREQALGVFRAHAAQALPPQTMVDPDSDPARPSFTGGPDPYTMRLCEEMEQRALSRLTELLDAGRTRDAEVVRRELLAVWEPFWSPPADAAARPFPPPFTPDQDRNDFSRRARDLVVRVLDARPDLAR